MPIKDPEERRKYQRERAKAKYDNDPEYAERRKQLAKEYRERHPDRVKAAKAETYARNAPAIQAARKLNRSAAYIAEIKRQYSLTKEGYDELVERTEGRCEICGDKPRVLAVDHCHRTKFVRGLLCKRCNTGLGYFRDRTDIMAQAIRYLRRATRELPTSASDLPPLHETLPIYMLQNKTTYRLREHKQRNCAYCGNEFTALRVTRIYCSKKCSVTVNNAKLRDRKKGADPSALS